MPDLDFTGLFQAFAFFAVLAIAALIAVGVSWLGYPTVSLWIAGAGVVAGCFAARLLGRLF